MITLIKFYIQVLSFAIIFFIGFKAFAVTPPGPPLDITLECQGDCSIAILKWHANPTGPMAQGFKLYRATGQTENRSDFSVYWSSENMDSIIHTPDGFLSTQIFLNPGNFSFFMTAFNESGESPRSKIVYKNIADNNIHIHFTSTPVTIGYINEIYEYKVKAVATNNARDISNDIRYSIVKAPDGMNIDSISGEIRWTPALVNTYSVIIKAQLVHSPNNYEFHQFQVVVKNCRLKSYISGTITDQNNNLVTLGNIEVYNKTGTDNSSIVLLNTVKFANGKFHIEVDEGVFLLHFVGDLFEKEWYINAFELRDATPIKIECGDSASISVKVNAVDSNITYNVKGVVKKASDSLPVPYILITFFGKNIVTGAINSFSIITDNTGSYGLRLSDKLTYTVLARTLDTLNGPKLLPQYFYNADDPASATPIVLTSDRDDINFLLKEKPDNTNKLSGLVENDSGQVISNANIILYHIGPGNDTNKLYNARATISDDKGKFTFTNISPGEYILLAYTLDKLYIPGYYKENAISVRVWKEATKIIVTASFTSDKFKIQLATRTALNTALNGKISGIITHKKSIIKANEDTPQSDEPIAGALVFVDNNNTHKINNFTITDNSGYYLISYLAKGTYKITIDKVGFMMYSDTVNVADDNSEIDKSVVLYQPITDVENNEIEYSENITAFPNPASNQVTFAFNLTNNLKSRIEVMNTIGLIVFEDYLNVINGNNTFTINCNTYQNGTYFFRISNQTETKLIKFIIYK